MLHNALWQVKKLKPYDTLLVQPPVPLLAPGRGFVMRR